MKKRFARLKLKSSYRASQVSHTRALGSSRLKCRRQVGGVHSTRYVSRGIRCKAVEVDGNEREKYENEPQVDKELFEEEEEIEEEGAADQSLDIDSDLQFAYDSSLDDELAVSLFGLKTSQDEDEEDEQEDEGVGKKFVEHTSAQGYTMERVGDSDNEYDDEDEDLVYGNDEDDNNENTTKAKASEDYEDSSNYYDPSDWRSLQLLAESEEDFENMDEFNEESDDSGQALLDDIHDTDLAKLFFEEASAEQKRAFEKQSLMSAQMLSEKFGTTIQKRRKKKKGNVTSMVSKATEAEDSELEEDKVNLVHPAQATSNSEWYPETSERCIDFHQNLMECAAEGQGDDAVLVLEEMRSRGILPGPRAYHAAIHAYSVEGNLIGAINTMKQAFEFMVPPPLESALVITRMMLSNKEVASSLYSDMSHSEYFQSVLLRAWQWLGYDTNKIANTGIATMLNAAGGELESALDLFENRAVCPVRWFVNQEVLLQLISSLCKSSKGGKGDRKAVRILQFGLHNERELSLVTEAHLLPLVFFPIQSGDLERSLYNLKVCLVSIANPYLDFKKDLIGLFTLLLGAHIDRATFEDNAIANSALYGEWAALDVLREQHSVQPDSKWHRQALYVLLNSPQDPIQSEQNAYAILEHMAVIFKCQRNISTGHGLNQDALMLQDAEGDTTLWNDEILLQKLLFYFSNHGSPAPLLYTIALGQSVKAEVALSQKIDQSIEDDTNQSVVSLWLQNWKELYEPLPNPTKEAKAIAQKMMNSDAATPSTYFVDDQGCVADKLSDGNSARVPIREMSYIQLMAECLARGLNASRHSLMVDLCMRVYAARCNTKDFNEEDDSEGNGDEQASSNNGIMHSPSEDTVIEEIDADEERMLKVVNDLIEDETFIEQETGIHSEQVMQNSEASADNQVSMSDVNNLQTPAALGVRIATACEQIGCKNVPTEGDIDILMSTCEQYSDALSAYDLAFHFGTKYESIQDKAISVCNNLGRSDIAKRIEDIYVVGHNE